MISAIGTSLAHHDQTRNHKSFSFCAGIPFHNRLEMLQLVHFSGSFIPQACGELSPLVFVPRVPLELPVSPAPLPCSQGAPGWLNSEKQLRGRVQAQLPSEEKVNCLAASQILT